MNAIRLSIVFCLLACALAGCGKNSAPAPEAAAPAEPPKKAFAAPSAPDEGNIAEALVARGMVQDGSAAVRAKLSSYTQDLQISGGTLRGLCIIPFQKQVWVPARMVGMDAARAEGAAEPGEAETFAQRQPRESVRLGGWHVYTKRWGVAGAVIRIRGIQAGSRAPLAYPRFAVNGASRQIEINPGSAGNSGIAIAPLGERIQFRNGEMHACKLAVSSLASGKTACECALAPYADAKFPGQPFKHDSGMANPAVAMSAPLLEAGFYKITCQRHAWQQAYLCLAENPYVTLSHGGWNEAGSYALDQIPPGKYKVEVWHPDFEPVSREHEVEITANQATELLIPFKTPRVVEEATAEPDQEIKAWLCAGPFANTDGAGHAEAFPPEKKFDAAARYTGKEGAAFGWKPAAGSKGSVTLADAENGATYYYHAALDAPADQPIVFGVGMNGGLKIWLNGALIYAQISGRHGNLQPNDMVSGKLKRGSNSLLLKLSGQTGSGALLKFKSDGAAAKAP